MGGSGNVVKCGNCMICLCLMLNNFVFVDYVVLKKIFGVMGVVESDV